MVSVLLITNPSLYSVSNAVHRDLRPDNLLIKELSSGSTTLKISDFGISRRVDSGTVTTEEHRGDIDWTAHEIAMAKKKKVPVKYVCS